MVADVSTLPAPWILDLDGVLWLADEPVPGSVEAVERLRASGHRVLFVTNNSSIRVTDYLEKFVRIGLHVVAEDLCTSAQAAALLLSAGSTALVCAGQGVVEALGERGIQAIHDVAPGASVDAVVVGFHRNFDYERLCAAHHAIVRGARFIATNDDATYPTPDGPIPGGGSIMAAIAYATGRRAEVAGKPFAPTVALVRERLGMTEHQDASSITMVGDRPSTDGGFARALGARFALVLSGVTRRSDLPVVPIPDVVEADLASLVDAGR